LLRVCPLALREGLLADSLDLGLEFHERGDVLFERKILGSGVDFFIIFLVVGKIRILDVTDLTFHDGVLLVDELSELLVGGQLMWSHEAALSHGWCGEGNLCLAGPLD
jgi:hypothetical protein